MQEDPLLPDSGYTQEEIDAIFHSLTKGEDRDVDDGFWFGLQVGLWDGCLLQVDDGGATVKVSTPRNGLDRRIAAVRAAIEGGGTLQRAVEMLQRGPV